ncbi:MAG: hypothetical protein JWM12_399, partial [Ilumatobacteraceae bacterium]|nr:hypothetical protein [Ilumatobacteraceae bacterium]
MAAIDAAAKLHWRPLPSTAPTRSPSDMTDVVRDPLWRLVELEQRQRQRSSTQAPAQPASPPGRRRLGYSPSLDGLRAISVVAVILYHAGFSWTKGGFYGVEVFFVVSGFLITSLLLEEREVDGGVSLRAFWIRRARRLLPALFTMLLAVSVWARLFGTAEQQNQLRRDLPWSIFYVANWGQVFSKAAYYSPVDPPLLRHMWSLAVEEQWYLVWPMVFIGLVALGWSRRTRGAVLVGVFATLWLWMWWLTRPGLAAPMKVPDPFHGGTATVDRANALYLSTFTRAGGLLLGAGVAHLWRPWRRTRPVDPTRAQVIEAYGLGALVGLIIVFARADLAAAYTFQWLLPIVSLLSVIVVATAVHPQSVVVRRLLSWQPLVVVGRRSYGLYLWHWPIFVFLAVENGGGVRLVAALVLTVAVSELCYRFVETPIRKGAIGDLVARLRADRANGPTATSRRTGVAVAGSMVLIGALVVSYVRLQPFDRAAGGA